MSEQESFHYEIEVKVSAHGQPDAFVRREYHSDKASTDSAAGELWQAVSNNAKARMRPVADGS